MTSSVSTVRAQSYVLAPGEGQALNVGPNERHVWKATGAMTGGGLDLSEVTADPGAGPPEHIHHLNDEAFYVLEGTFEFKVGGRRFLAPAGTFVFVPRGEAHAWANAGDQPARLILLFTPGDLQRFFVELEPLMRAEPNDVERIQALSEQFLVEMVGPPLAQQAAV
jgi:quercetin dioxygenase-like cupin family protein